MQAQRISVEQFKKAIHQNQQNPLKRKFTIDIISEKVGSQNLAYILVIFSSIAYPLGFLYSNDNNFNVIQTSLMRGLVTVLMNFFIARLYCIDLEYKDPSNFRILLLRNFIMIIQGLVFTVLQFILTQPIINTINSTGPLFIFLLDYKINGITINQKQVYGVILGVIGVLLTINGEYIIRFIDPSYSTPSQFENYRTDDPFYKSMAALVFVLVQFLWAYAQIITKRLHQVNVIQINFHLGIQIFLSSALLYPSCVLQPVPVDKFITSIFVGGIVMVIGQIGFIGAITMTKNTGVLTMLVFVSVISSYAVSVVKYNQKINPFCSIGAVIIVFGLAKIVFNKSQLSKVQVQQKISQK